MGDSSLDDAELPGDDFSEDLRGRVKQELDPGERLLWTGRPLPETPRAAVGLIVWGAIAGLLLAVAIASFVGPRANGFRRDVSGLQTFGLAMLVLDFFVVFGIVTALKNRRATRARRAGTLYALTDRRAIIWMPEGWKDALRVESVSGNGLTGVYRREYPDGSGDVRFKFASTISSEFEYAETIGFEGVADVRIVEERVRRTLLSTENRMS